MDALKLFLESSVSLLIGFLGNTGFSASLLLAPFVILLFGYIVDILRLVWVSLWKI